MGQMSTESDDLALVKESFSKVVNYGEYQTEDAWKLEIDGYDDLTWMVTNVQIPEVTRTRIEDFGPMGVQITRPGKIKNAVDITMTFKEVRQGASLDDLMKIAKDGEFFDFTLTLLPDGEPKRYEDCFIETNNALDLGYDSNAIMKPNVTIVCNMPHPFSE